MNLEEAIKKGKELNPNVYPGSGVPFRVLAVGSGTERKSTLCACAIGFAYLGACNITLPSGMEGNPLLDEWNDRAYGWANFQNLGSRGEDLYELNDLLFSYNNGVLHEDFLNNGAPSWEKYFEVLQHEAFELMEKEVTCDNPEQY